jgi:hypothetical protein
MGRLANKPMQNELKAAMAAVAVTKSRLGLSVIQLSLLSAGQTQLPPLSATMVAWIC